MAGSAILRIDILGDASSAKKALGSLGGSFTKLGKFAAAGAAAGVAALGVLAVASVKSASDLEQSLGGAQAVFGSYFGDVEKKAKSAATALGLSQNEYYVQAAQLGSLLSSSGTPADKLAGQVDGLITKGADLAATFGGTTSDAVNALSSAFKGEYDPLEKYGISIKKSDINARLAAEGNSKLTGTALKLAEQQAASAIIAEQGAKATGQFTAQTGTLAVQQQILGAQFENVKATLGAKLLPILSRAFTYLTTVAAPAVQKLAEGLGDRLEPTIKNVSSFVSDKLVPAITDKLVPAAISLYGWFVEKIVPGIVGFVVPVFNGLRDGVSRISEKVQENSDKFAQVFAAIKTVSEFIFGTLVPILGNVLAPAFAAIGFWIGFAIDFVLTLATTFLDLVGTISGAMASSYKFVAGFVSDVVGAITGLPGTLKRLGSTFLDAGKELIGKLFDGLLEAPGAIAGFALNLGRQVANKLIDALNSVLPHRLEVHIPIPGAPDINVGIPLFPEIPHFTGAAGAAGSWDSRLLPVLEDNSRVSVYIGDQEITAIVRTEVRRELRATASRVSGGIR